MLKSDMRSFFYVIIFTLIKQFKENFNLQLSAKPTNTYQIHLHLVKHNQWPVHYKPIILMRKCPEHSLCINPAILYAIGISEISHNHQILQLYLTLQQGCVYAMSHTSESGHWQPNAAEIL